jgi:hypothetical protein
MQPSESLIMRQSLLPVVSGKPNVELGQLITSFLKAI